MKTLINVCFVALIAFVALSGCAFAETAGSVEARLKELNITLPQIPPPVAITWIRSGSVPCCSFPETLRPGKYKGKLGKDLTTQEGYDTAREVGLIMLAKV